MSDNRESHKESKDFNKHPGNKTQKWKKANRRKSNRDIERLAKNNPEDLDNYDDLYSDQ